MPEIDLPLNPLALAMGILKRNAGSQVFKSDVNRQSIVLVQNSGLRLRFIDILDAEKLSMIFISADKHLLEAACNSHLSCRRASWTHNPSYMNLIFLFNFKKLLTKTEKDGIINKLSQEDDDAGFKDSLNKT